VKVSICTPVYQDPSYAYTTSLAGLLLRPRPADLDLQCIHARGPAVCVNRNSMAAAALESGSDFILWIDADQLFPAHALEALLAHSAPIVACNYSTKTNPQRSTVQGPIGTDVTSPADGPATQEVDRAGFGLILTAAEVFRRMPRPWFVQDNGISEDYNFCDHARELGFSILVDHRLSREVGHVGQAVYRLP
jgi:hypothetical protein